MYRTNRIICTIISDTDYIAMVSLRDVYKEATCFMDIVCEKALAIFCIDMAFSPEHFLQWLIRSHWLGFSS